MPLHPTFPGQPQVQAGLQTTVSFAAALQARETQAVDLVASSHVGIWRVSAIASRPVRVNARLIYGTASSFTLENIRLPLVAYVPGNVQLYVNPEASPPAEAIHVRVSAKLVSSGTQTVRTFHDATAGAVDLPASVASYTALVAGSVTVEGVAVALGVNQQLKVTAPAVLTAGAGIVEHEL